MKKFDLSVVFVLGLVCAAFGQLSDAGSRQGGTTYGFNSPDDAIVATRKGPSEKARFEALEAVRKIALEMPLTDAKSTNAVKKAIGTVRDFWLGRRDWDKAAAFCGELARVRKDYLGQKDVRVWLAREAGGYCRAGFEKIYREKAAAFVRAGVFETDLGALAEFAAEVCRGCYSHEQRWDEIDAFIRPWAEKRRTFEPKNRATMVVQLLAAARGRDDLKRVKALYAELKELGEERRWRREYLSYLSNSWQDWEAELAERRAAPPAKGDVHGCYDYAVTLVRNGFRDEARAILADISTNRSTRGEFAFQVYEFGAYLDSKTPAEFCDKLLALESRKEELKQKDDTPLKVDQRFFFAVRDAARLVYSLSTKPEALPWCRAISKMTREKMMHPEERLTYRAKYLKNAPSSAEAALRAGVFTQLPQENRIGRYAVYNHFDNKGPGWKMFNRRDPNLIKSAENVKLAADVPGKEASVCVAFDDAGLHVYARFNDPNAGKTRLGIEDKFNVEYVLNAGDNDGVWHWNMLTALDQGFDAGVEWDAPRKGYKIGRDYLKTDVYVSDDCYVFHLYAPWILHWTRLPQNGDAWRLALIVGWGDQFGALGGGMVHELSHAMRIVFDLTPEERQAMRRGLLNEAAGDFKKANAKWENAGFWEDPHMGDPDFYYKEVEPLVMALNKDAKALADGPDAETFERLWNERLESWADFILTVNALRVKWLEEHP